MIKNKTARYFEIVLYVLIWMIAISVPFYMTWSKTGNFRSDFLFKEWLKLLPFFIIFLINNFVTAPKLLLKGKYVPYIFSCILLIAVVLAADHFSPFERPGEFGFRPERGPGRIPGFPEPHGPVRHFRPPGIIVGHLLVYFLIIGFNSGIKIFVRWTEEQNIRSEKEKQHLATELAFLKHQISPHFFMNTLNNIHSLIDINAEQAKDSVIKLSRLMRYLLYESEPDKTSLKKELDFMESYIELMRLRYDEETLSVQLSYPENTEDVKVPSFLFMSFIENAFKHGVDSRYKSFIDIEFKIKDDKLSFMIKNSLFDRSNDSVKDISGIGLDNVRKRLDLIYKNNYTFAVVLVEEVYGISLEIPLR